MRKIKRSISSCPELLKPNNLKREKKELIKYYSLEPEDRRLSRAPFNNEKLFNPQVSNALYKTFSGRCAWCETKIDESSINIEHFRPKSNAIGGNDRSSSDHYGWFVYEWDNLFLACKECSHAKANHFPVESLRAKPLSTWSEANALERVQLIDPCKDDPLRHISLLQNGSLSPMTEKGELTVDIFNLNRGDLKKQRKKIIEELEFIFKNEVETIRILKFLTDESLPKGVIYLYFSLFIVAEGRVSSTAAVEKMISDIMRASHFPRDMQWMAITGIIWSDIYYNKSIIDDSYSYSENYSEAKKRNIRRISNISIKNFKGLEELSLDFPDKSNDGLAACIMLLGENSTGKSSILQAITLAMMDKNQRNKLGLSFPDYMTKDSGTWFNSNWEEAHVMLKFDDGSCVKYEIDKDFNSNGKGEGSIVFLAYGARRYIGKPGVKKATQPNRTLFDPLALIPSPIEWLNNLETEDFESVARAMKEILSLKQDDSLHKDNDGNVYVHAHKRMIPLEQMSDGYKTIFYVVLDIMRNMIARWDNFEYATGIVLIDEIETHLHPRWKMQVVGALRRAMPNVQFILTTHDPLCLRGMFDGEVHVLRRDSDNKIIEETDLPSFQGLRTEQILTSDYFGLLTTNDPDIENKIERYAFEHSMQSGNMHYISLVEKEISQMAVLGETLSERVIYEALARYLNSVKRKSFDVLEAKEDAIKEIIKILESKGV